MPNFHPDTGRRRWSLVQVRLFSPAAGREGRCRQRSLCVGSTRRVPATLSLPRSQVCALPVYTAQAPGCSTGSGPCLVRFPFSGPPQKCRLGWACVLCLPRQAAQAARSLTGSLSRVRCQQHQPHFRLRWSGAPCVCSGELASSRDPPGGCQPSRISGSLWLETGSLFAVWYGVPSLGQSLPLSPPPCLLPPAGDGLVCSRLALLWNYSVLCASNGPAVCSVSVSSLFAG